MAAALLLAVTGFVRAQESANPAYITFAEAVIPQGGTGEMEVYYTVDNSQLFKAVQINVSLPTGITIENVEMKLRPEGIAEGKYSSLSDDNTYDPASKFFATSNVKDGKNVVIGFQTGNVTFPATTGEKTLLCTLTLKAAESVATNTYEDAGYSSTTSYIELTSSDTKVMASQNQNLTIKVFQKGDVNADGDVDITDAVCIVYNDLGQTPNRFYPQVGDMNGDKGVDLSDAISIVYKSLGQQANSNAIFDEELEELLDPR